MKLPEMNGLEVLGLVGRGESGSVFAVRNEAGDVLALKVFEGMAVNRALVSRMVARLQAGGWPEGVAEIESADFGGKPACWVLPMYGEQEGEGESAIWYPASLQHRLAEHPGGDTWGLVRQIGEALAGMHARRVAHGNLKPGNVFFAEDGGVRLTDWTLGNMPGIAHSGFTDALLYQAPEQLLDPGGYFEEEGYGWDVFAFGALAFRLLTGRFPRCNEIFSTVAPEPGETRKDGIHADSAKIAKSLRQHEDVSWGSEPGNDLEGAYRHWIVSCLHLDAAQRPATMMEVMAGFANADLEASGEAEREALLDQRRHAERRGRRRLFFAGATTAGCLALGGMWISTLKEMGYVRSELGRKITYLEIKRDVAAESLNTAIGEKEAAQREMEQERDLGLARLEASRQIGDRLFEWAMEKGHRNLPPLDGRELRLKRLDAFFEDFLTRTEGMESLEDERASVRLQLAEVALAAGDADAAERRLGEAVSGWTSVEMDGDMRLRLGRNALWLALLKQERNQEDAGGSFAVARAALEAVPQAEVDSQRLRQLVAILDFHEAKLLAAGGEEAMALSQLMRATKTLNELADARPDAAVLGSELAACYLSSATILEGMGKLGDAREVRSLAAAEMVRLLKDNPADIGLRLELAGCYGAMAEAAVLAGDVGSAKTVSNEAMKLLDEILRKQPDSTVAATRKAAQLGLRGGLLRDEGKSEEALAAFEEGINLLERPGAQRGGMVEYRLALLWWQKGRMLGFGGEKDEELSLLAKAREALRGLEARGTDSGVPPEGLQRSIAYLLGDYAHALELADKPQDAKAIYREAIAIWESLSKSRPQSEEYREGLEWCRQRAEGI
jgi:tetratricopeptide (TPR) repeat protein